MSSSNPITKISASDIQKIIHEQINKPCPRDLLQKSMMRQILKIKLRLAPSRHVEEAQVSVTQSARMHKSGFNLSERDQYQIVADMYLDLCAQQLVDIQKLIVLASMHESPGADFFRRTKSSFSPQRMLVLWATNEFTAYGKIKKGKLDMQKIDDHFWSLIINKITTRSLKLEEQQQGHALREYITYIHLKALYRNILVIYEEMMALQASSRHKGMAADCLDVPDEVTNKCIGLYNSIRQAYHTNADEPLQVDDRKTGSDAEFQSMVAQNRAHSTKLSSVLQEERGNIMTAARIVSDTARTLQTARDACTSLECVYREILAAQSSTTPASHQCPNLGMLKTYGKYSTEQRNRSLSSFDASLVELHKLNKVRQFNLTTQELKQDFDRILSMCKSLKSPATKLSILQKEEIAHQIDAFVDSYNDMRSELKGAIDSLIQRLERYNTALRNAARTLTRTADPRELMDALTKALADPHLKGLSEAVAKANAWLNPSDEDQSSESESESGSGSGPGRGSGPDSSVRRIGQQTNVSLTPSLQSSDSDSDSYTQSSDSDSEADDFESAVEVPKPSRKHS